MPLSDDIRALRDRVLAELRDAHDYYTDTKLAWEIVLKVVATGYKISSHNIATGTITTETELADKARAYIKKQVAEATFQQFISIFDDFLFDLLRHWLLAYPRSLGGKKVDFEAVLDAPDKEAIALMVVNRELNDISYDRPAGWFKYLDDRVKLGCPTPDEINRIAEAKASRDAIVHNRGVASKTYELKAGAFARYKVGQRIDIPERYHRDTWELLRKIVTDISNAAIAKVP